MLPQRQQRAAPAAITTKQQQKQAAIKNSSTDPTTLSSKNMTTAITRNTTNNTTTIASSSPLMGEASGVAFLLGDHSKFGLAERCCYHFDLIETLTSLPLSRSQQHSRVSRRDRGLSVSSQEGGATNLHNNNTSSQAANTNSDDGVHYIQGKSNDTTIASSPAAASSSSGGKTTTVAKGSCICGVVSLLECVATVGGAQAERATRRVLRSKHREFNTRAQAAWGRGSGGVGGGGGSASSSKQQRNNEKLLRSGGGIGGGSSSSSSVRRRCYQPRHLPLPLNPNTRVTFAYELTSIAIVVDASPSLTATTFGTMYTNNMNTFDCVGSEEKSSTTLPTMVDDDGCCVPLDRLGRTLKTYLLGLIQPIDIPPVAVSGKGVAFGRWTPNLAVTVVAAYPPTSNGDEASAGLLVRDFRVTDEVSVLELIRHVERWALREVEGTIAERLCGQRDFVGDGVAGRKLGSQQQHQRNNIMSTKHVKTSLKELLAVGDAALSTLPSEGRPIILVASDCKNLECTTTFEFLTATDRTDVPLSVIDLSLNSRGQEVHYAYDCSSSLPDACQMSGGIFLDRELLESCVKAKAGSAARQKQTDLQLSQISPLDDQSRFQGDIHFCSKKRSIRPNALQWYTLFILSPFTPGGYSLSSVPRPIKSVSTSPTNSFFHSSSVSLTNIGYAKQSSSKLHIDRRTSMDDSKSKDVPILSPSTTSQERIMFSKYSIQPVRIKSLLMSRVLEGYRARRYGHTTQDSDKVSIHFTLRLAECDVVLHYEVSFVSSPWHIPTVGNAHIKLELSGENTDFIQTVKKLFMSNRAAEMVQHGKRIPAAAEQICKLLRWIRKEDYLDSYLCLPGWGDVGHFSPGSSFVRRLETLSRLQRHRHFRSETLEVVTAGGGNPYERAESIFGDMEQNSGEKELFETLTSWSTEVISDAEMYLKEITPAREDDLAYYCIVRVAQCGEVSRLFSIIVDFHGELDTEQRLAILYTLEESLRSCAELLLLERGVSNYIALRPLLSNSVWIPSWDEYFLHHKSWELLKDPEVLPLLFKRRHIIGSFFILHADENRAVFCKFVQDDATQTSDMVMYQVLQRQDGIYVDIHMEACRAVFHPFRSKTFPLYALYERVRRRDEDCARNLRSRTNLLAELDSSNSMHDVCSSEQQEEDVTRIMKVSTPTITKIRFFSDGSGSANDILSNLIASYMTSDSFQTQTARLLVKKADGHEGVFFIMRLDWYVLSVACLEFRDQTESEDEVRKSYRALTFYTAGIIDLYQSDDETKVVDDATTSCEQFSEALPVNEIMEVHPKLYAIALYEALRNDDFPVTSIRSDEVSYAMSVFCFREVLHASITLNDLTEQVHLDSETSTGQRLADLIDTILTPVPGSDDTVFYYHGKAGSDLDCSGKAEAHIPITESNDLERFVEDYSHADNQSIGSEGERADVQSDSDCSPLYFRFTITSMGDVGGDENPVSLKDIRMLKRSAILTAQVSVFEHLDEKTLPLTHAHVTRKLQHALNEFAAEQTLDEYRYLGSESLATEDFKIVMRNLSQSKHHVLKIPITFYVSRSNSMIKASDPTGVNESDLDHGYSTLLSEFDASKFTLKSSSDSFLVVDEASSEILRYWCFIQVKKSSGSVIVRVHHPLGREAAQERAETTVSLVKKMLDRTNQKLLLESMYRTRKAPAELFADREVDESTAVATPEEPSPPVSNRGMYACPVQYQHEFPLHRRVSPSQAVRTLHSSILQNFMLSNRNGVSVYRDESNNIYYMNLSYRKSIRQDDEENSHVIELLVYGVEQPGPVITEELVRLLQRKLLMLPLDALSSVLNKNPQYNLLATDMSFINNFSRRLKEIEPDIELNNNNWLRTYELPSHVEDPLSLLLMFRQNICGSTFIQLLHHESNDSHTQLSYMMEVNAEDGSIILNGLPGNEFCFFFNSLGLGLDPAAQHVTTLTDQGRIYSRQAGSGIAVIQVSLLHGSSSVGRICVGKGDTMLETNFGVSNEYTSLNPVTPDSKGTYKLVVKVTNTTVDVEAIQKWVNLSLCQVLAAYTIERHRESCLQSASITCTSSAKGNREALSILMPGLPPLEDMMTIAVDLPHPAMMKIQSKTRLQATSLAVLALDLTEKAVLSAIFNKSTRLPYEGVEIFRVANTASRVSVTRDRILKAKVVSSESGRVIKDNHVDCPEYICVFGLRQSDGNPINSPHHLFFKEIHVPRPETSVFTEVLHRIRSLKPALFELHMVFILRVSRNSRSLITYNVSPQIWAAMKTNFNDIEGELSRAEETRREHCVGRCMEQFPFMARNQQVAAVSNAVKATEPQAPTKKQPPKEESVVDTGPPVRRIKRPTSMLRPKLIGKSVDGAAAQAVQASRLRAKTRPSVQQRTGSVSKLTSPVPSNQKKQLKDKPTQQKQRREAAQKDTVGRSVVHVVPASNLLKFYRDLTAVLKEASGSHFVEPMLSQSVLQYVTHTYFVSMKERQSPLMFTRLISNCYGFPIGCGSICHLQCDTELSSMKSFLQFITARWRANAVQSTYPQFVYLQKDLLISQRRRASIMIEILIIWDRFEKCYILSYKAWLINSSDNSKNPMQLARAHAEQEAAAVDAISLDFMARLTLDSQVLNFAGSRLKRAARKPDGQLNTLALLRCTFKRFSEQVQSDYCLEGSADYMLQRRFLAPSTFLSKELIENYDRTELFEYFSSDGKAYKLSDCTGAGEKVFACEMLTIAGFSCHVFIAAHEAVDSALEVFTLCMTRGKRVDTYVAIEGSLFAERICDVVLECTMTAVEKLITAAAIKMRNVHLWRRFGSDFASTPAVSEVQMNELRQCCHCIDLMDTEPRLRVLLTEEAYELQMPWDDIFKSFDRSPLFHCIRFDRGNETNWVVYCRENDVFVDIISESSSSLAHKQFRSFQILLKDNIREQKTAKIASEQVVSFILNRVWDDCSIH